MEFKDDSSWIETILVFEILTGARKWGCEQIIRQIGFNSLLHIESY